MRTFKALLEQFGRQMYTSMYLFRWRRRLLELRLIQEVIDIVFGGAASAHIRGSAVLEVVGPVTKTRMQENIRTDDENDGSKTCNVIFTSMIKAFRVQTTTPAFCLSVQLSFRDGHTWLWVLP